MEVSGAQSTIADIASRFDIAGVFESADVFGDGHINSTFASRWKQGGAVVRYLHQKINTTVFTRPTELMDNIRRVTSFVRQKLLDAGVTDVDRRTLTIVPAKDGKTYTEDSEGGFWRTYLFIENTVSLPAARNPSDAFTLGESVGRFHNLLSTLPSPPLFDTIPNFHNMKMRYTRFYEALGADVKNRAKDVAAEIGFFKQNEERGMALLNALESGSVPVRITHNDTKMNNILLDKTTGEALCLVDLDTVMPGLSLYDTGDLIRTACNSAGEDETDAARIKFNLDFFEALIKGYLKEARSFLNGAEMSLLAESGRNITQIMGLRFLTDYLAGDVYYKIDRPSHNIDRSRNQIALIKSMDAVWGDVENACIN